MATPLSDLISLLAFSGLMFGGATLGVLALPWTDRELRDTSRAVRRTWRRLDASVSRTLGRAVVATDSPRTR
jgi:hypothetical protein